MALDLLKIGVSYAPVHFLTHYRKRTVDWIPTDTKEAYDENCKDPALKEYLSRWDGQISYKLNSQGFRTSEMNADTSSLVALGCSHTFGVGLKEDEVYCSILAEKLGCRMFNLGVPGCAADTVYRIASYWLPIIQPKYVVMVGPQDSRFEIRCAPSDEHVFVPSDNTADDIYKQMIKRYIANPENPVINKQKNLLAIENITQRFGGKFYSYSENMKVVDRARDNSHYGPISHRNLAENIYNDIMGI